MPCLFFRNVPAGRGFSSYECTRLYEEVADACGLSSEDVEVHIENTSYVFLLPSGFTEKHGVHVYVEWHEGRSPETKERIAKAIHGFLDYHELGKGSDVVFRDSSRGSFFFEGKRVP